MDADRLQQLFDKDEITDAIHRVARGTDRLDHELIVSGYHPDGYDDHNSFRGGPGEFADWVLTVLAHFDATHHFLGQTRIELDGDTAFTETYCSAHHVIEARDDIPGTDMRMGLRYVDRFERRNGGPWLIARRVCAFDWRYTVEFTHMWTYDDDFTVGRRDRSDVTYR